MKRLLLCVCLVIVFAGKTFAGDVFTREDLEKRRKELEGLLIQVEQVYVTTQGRLAEIKNLLEELDKKEGEKHEEKK